MPFFQIAGVLILPLSAWSHDAIPRNLERFPNVDPTVHDLAIRPLPVDHPVNSPDLPNGPGAQPLPDPSSNTFYVNGSLVRADRMYSSPDPRYVIVDNFSFTSGRTQILADRVTFSRQEVVDWQIPAFHASNLRVVRGHSQLDLGVATVRATSSTSLQVTSTRLTWNESGAVKFTTRDGPTGMEVASATLSAEGDDQMELAVNTEVGFAYHRNPQDPASDLTIDTNGGARSVCATDMSGGSSCQRFSYLSAHPVHVNDPKKGQELFLEGQIAVSGVNQDETQVGRASLGSTDYAASADRARIVRGARDEMISLEGGSGQQTRDKVLDETYGTVSGVHFRKTRGDADMQVFNGTYRFADDPTRKVEHLRADKGFYHGAREAVEFQGDVEASRVTETSTALRAAHISGGQMTFSQSRGGTGTFANARLSLVENADGSEDQVLKADRGSYVNGDSLFTVSGRTELRRRMMADRTMTFFEGSGKSISYIDERRQRRISASAVTFSNASGTAGEGVHAAESDTTIADFKDVKFTIADPRRAREYFGEIGQANYYKDSYAHHVVARDLRNWKMNDVQAMREVLFSGKQFARYQDRDGELLTLEQGRLQVTDRQGQLSLTVNALEYMKHNGTDPILKRIDVSGEGSYRGLEGKFRIDAHDLRIVREDVEENGRKIKYYGFAPISAESYLEVIHVESGPFSLEMKGGTSAGVKLITDKPSGRLALLGFVHDGSKLEMKAGPLKLTGSKEPHGSEILMNLTAVGTHHQMLLEQIAGLVNEVPVNSRLAYNEQGFFKVRLPFSAKWGAKVTYKGANSFENVSNYYENKADSLVVSIEREMKSEARYGFDVGLLGTSALRVDVNHRCGVRLFGSCLGEETLVPMTAFVGASRCGYREGGTGCTQVGGTYDLTTAALKDASPEARGLRDGRSAGGANVVLARSVTLANETRHTVSATAGEKNGIAYRFSIPIRTGDKSSRR